MPNNDDAGERRRKRKEEIGSSRRGKAFIWKKGIRVQYTKEDFYNKLISIQNENKLTEFDENENS